MSLSNHVGNFFCFIICVINNTVLCICNFWHSTVYWLVATALYLKFAKMKFLTVITFFFLPFKIWNIYWVYNKGGPGNTMIMVTPLLIFSRYTEIWNQHSAYSQSSKRVSMSSHLGRSCGSAQQSAFQVQYNKFVPPENPNKLTFLKYTGFKTMQKNQLMF